MDFDLTDEQNLLKETVDRLVADNYGTLEQITAHRAAPGGFREEGWQRLAELGLLGLPFSEADGGFNGGPVETQIVMEALGRGLAPEPYLPTVLLGGGVLRRAGTDAQRQSIIPGIIDGTLRLAFAHTEPRARYDLHDVATQAVRQPDGSYRLDGHKSVVLSADTARWFVVSARTAGARRDEEGISLFLVPADAPGLSVEAYPTHDGGRAGNVFLAGVTVPADALIGERDAGLAVIEWVNGVAIAAVAAEAVGIMEALQALTVDYLKTRRQFGATIGSFQALQHQTVDILIATEQARSMSYFAAMMLDEPDAGARSLALSSAKVQINRSARLVGQKAVQLHGGIGMTMEYLGAHYFRRLALLETQFGDTTHHLRRVAQSEGLVQAG
ncbi:pimeloyl-CoA dehydrogenase small subunit [Pseudochelatococcus lubricantis]|uniref:Pimeloyl-CoA dehydrogenase small subunit n=1 Tax=Pseudochelatococcus lubricantis TaxID=1538102 RepID=A0ABX0V4C7_9HYPH|nr:acyl-CoA dehydrogenase family protein [Pseudochelatococcus lubricantis]NIJ57936.1 pimeloyl-CoA dehydrogenase small subunit [Pseudochelatococcus lubricantis]